MMCNTNTKIQNYSKGGRHDPNECHTARQRTEQFVDRMLQRNKEFAARQSADGTLMPSLPRALPNVKAVIIGCADMRVDPAHVLGIKLGEAVVLRNIGGRINLGAVEAVTSTRANRRSCRRDSRRRRGFHLVVLHHTDCGSTRLVGDPAMLGALVFGYRG